MEGSFRLVSSLALVFAGIVWLVAAELLHRFFDQLCRVTKTSVAVTKRNDDMSS